MTQHHVDGLEVAVTSLAATANLEVIPLNGAQDKIRAAAPGTTITVTCSPKFGLERSLEHIASARLAGYDVIPHLAARMVSSEAALRDFVSRICDLGVTDLYVVGGDGAVPDGPYAEASEILEALRDFDHDLIRLGVGCYPEGHPKIAAETLLDALHRKQEYADYMVSQLCFDAQTLRTWLERTRDAGVILPLRIGLAAPISIAKLLELSLRIGVGSSVRYLRKQHGMVGNLVLGRTYAPEGLLHELGPALTDPRHNIEGLHLFTFNQLDASVGWCARVGSSTR
ncbi:methylenetetrahydrofolate reductase [Nocardioides sp. LMS-CY]|uniref:methylenetetrahydrofolate reductase n=1 Tax=Nocardioides sp. (strain LMS-CY) TaxID=2840457 RepID=UPI001C003325|nr:methylenetetrahydrofolate reductase [Nocardioides sp. LMS-CY]QWF20479.1 methylenetetrahydrofolate reductase [Nocardioides sp. LMS-CY]